MSLLDAMPRVRAALLACQGVVQADSVYIVVEARRVRLLERQVQAYREREALFEAELRNRVLVEDLYRQAERRRRLWRWSAGGAVVAGAVAVVLIR